MQFQGDPQSVVVGGKAKLQFHPVAFKPKVGADKSCGTFLSTSLGTKEHTKTELKPKFYT